MPTLKQICYLYNNQKLSSKEVGKRLRISQWQVIKIMKRNNIPRRSASEADHIVFSNKPPSYSKKTKLSTTEQRLRTAMLMLYWAEGAKGRHTVDFANSDSKMAKLFLNGLRTIYRIDEKRLRVYLFCYKNQKIKNLVNYWSKLLNIPKNQFSKPYVRKDFDERKINKMIHGLAHIRYSDKKLLMQIEAEIDIIQMKLNAPRWLSGQKHGSVEPTIEKSTQVRVLTLAQH